jgi:hypothetical protein
MTITIKKSINFLLTLTTFLIGLVAFGSVNVNAYNNKEYLIACPTDYPYCNYTPSNNSTNYCNLPSDFYATDCAINVVDYGYSTISYNNTSGNNYNNNNCTSFNQYYYPCNYNYSTTKTSTYYPPITNNSYYNDYCTYLNSNNCQNIAVNPPKTYNEPYISVPTYTDPIRNCTLNTGNCVGSTMNNNVTTNNSFESLITANDRIYSHPYSNTFEALVPATDTFTTVYNNNQGSYITDSNQATYQDYYILDPISGGQDIYNNYYYAG